MSPDFEKSPCLLHFHFSWNKKYHLKKIKQPIFKKNIVHSNKHEKSSTPQPPETASTFSVFKVDSKDLMQSLAALLN